MASCHFGSSWPLNKLASNATALPGGQSAALGFHVYAVEWGLKQVGLQGNNTKQGETAACHGSSIAAAGWVGGWVVDAASRPCRHVSFARIALHWCCSPPWALAALPLCLSAASPSLPVCVTLSASLPHHPLCLLRTACCLQMRWYLDGQLYFTVNSAGGNAALPGWHSTGRGAGRDSPFDQARTAAACVGGALPWSAAACRIALPGAPVTAVAPRSSPPFTACLPACLQDFHLLMGLALGSEASTFTAIDGVGITEAELRATLEQPKQLRVDWVRVYTCAAQVAPGGASGCVPAPAMTAKRSGL